jgi:tetratricopeptide (TPR) repeat protein
MDQAQTPNKQTHKNDKPLFEFAEESFANIQVALEQYNLVAAERACAALSKRVESECFKSDPLRVITLRWSSKIAAYMHDFEKAEQELTKAIMITAAHAVLGQREVQLRSLRMTQAGFLASRGRYDEALSLWQQARDQEGGDSSFRIAAIVGMAQTYRMQGQQQQYMNFMQQALIEMPTTVTQGLSGNHAGIFAEAAESELEAGRFLEAAGLYHESARILQQIPGVAAEAVRAVRLQVSECFKKAGKFQEACALQSRLLAESVSTLGADDPVTMSLRHSLAKSLIEQHGNS